jgi:hypothetical protein
MTSLDILIAVCFGIAMVSTFIGVVSFFYGNFETAIICAAVTIFTIVAVFGIEDGREAIDRKVEKYHFSYNEMTNAYGESFEEVYK